MLFQVLQKSVDILDPTPRFLENFLESENLYCGVMARKKAALVIF